MPLFLQNPPILVFLLPVGLAGLLSAYIYLSFITRDHTARSHTTSIIQPFDLMTVNDKLIVIAPA